MIVPPLGVGKESTLVPKIHQLEQYAPELQDNELVLSGVVLSGVVIVRTTARCKGKCDDQRREVIHF